MALRRPEKVSRLAPWKAVSPASPASLLAKAASMSSSRMIESSGASASRCAWGGGRGDEVYEDEGDEDEGDEDVAAHQPVVPHGPVGQVEHADTVLQLPWNAAHEESTNNP